MHALAGTKIVCPTPPPIKNINYRMGELLMVVKFKKFFMPYFLVSVAVEIILIIRQILL